MMMRCRQTCNATRSTTTTPISLVLMLYCVPCLRCPLYLFLSYAALRLKAQALVGAANVLSASGCRGDLGMMLGASSRGATTGLTVIREIANQGDPGAAHHPFLSNRGATLKTMVLMVEIPLEYSKDATSHPTPRVAPSGRAHLSERPKHL
jgi:hypothetical protein